jgi:nonsense-mediated mRNA decay protein 3
MRKFCFVCGKGTANLAEGRCEDCLKGRALAILPEKIEVTQCAKCGKALMKNKWIEYSPEKTAGSFAKVSGKLKRVEAKTDGKKLKMTFIIEPPSSGGETREEHEASFHINRIICPSCSRKHSGYYEAVLQLRGFGEGDMEKMNDIFEMIERKSFCLVKDVKGGVDIKIGNKLAVDSAAKIIRAKFPNSEMKKSSKIVTKIDGRDVHRKFILVRKS